MNSMLAFLADANSPTNRWLNEHPAVLGAGSLAIGGLLAFTGYHGLRKGETTDKYGIKLKGGIGMLTSVLRLGAGIALCGFGVYKVIAGWL